MPMRIYGLSGSGIDVDQMVKDMMKARRISYDKVVQQKSQMEWKKEDYNAIYKLAQEFRNSTISSFRHSSSLQPKQVTTSNDGVLTATANADAANVSHSIVVEKLAKGVTLTSSDAIGGNGTLFDKFGYTEANSPLQFTINGKEVSVELTASTTLNDVVKAINNAGAGVKANYDASLDRFYIYSNKTGAEAKVDFTGSSAEGLAFFTDKLKISTATTIGEDAKFKLDGVDLSKSTNNFTISGITYNLKTVSPKDIDGQPISTYVGVEADIEKTIANVKKFVEDYNAFIGALNSEIGEAKYRDFMPLTDEQKADMKEKEIEAWEKKARSGLLRNDSILTSLTSNLRLSFASPISGLTGDYKNASSIGITTDSFINEDGDFVPNYSNNGKLNVNEKELRAALTEDPDIVYKIFGSSGDTNETKGVANRLYDQVYSSLNRLKEQAGLPDAKDTTSFLAERLRDYDDRLYNMDRRIAEMEQRYYKQFDAMEVALSRLTQQNSWLMNMFSGGN